MTENRRGALLFVILGLSAAWFAIDRAKSVANKVELKKSAAELARKRVSMDSEGRLQVVDLNGLVTARLKADLTKDSWFETVNVEVDFPSLNQVGVGAWISADATYFVTWGWIPGDEEGIRGPRVLRTYSAGLAKYWQWTLPEGQVIASAPLLSPSKKLGILETRGSDSEAIYLWLWRQGQWQILTAPDGGVSLVASWRVATDWRLIGFEARRGDGAGQQSWVYSIGSGAWKAFPSAVLVEFAEGGVVRLLRDGRLVEESVL